MSAVAVVCPHCGHRHSAREVIGSKDTTSEKRKPLSISAEEAAALLSVKGVSGTSAGGARGPMALIVPRDSSGGWVRAFEWLLTVLAFPLLVGLLSLAMLSPRSWRTLRDTGEARLTLSAGTIGAVGLFLLTLGTPLSLQTVGIVVGVSAAALLVRLVLRTR